MTDKLKINLKGFKFYILATAIVALALVGIVLASSLKDSRNTDSIYVEQDVTNAEFNKQQEFPLMAEQDADTPFRIIDARVNVIPAAQYQMLTGLRTELPEVISAPNLTFQNVSNKTVVGLTVMINDKEAKTKFGTYTRNLSIRPGQTFVFRSENFVPISDNPAKNPKFWLPARDKSKVVVRVVVYFDDGTTWANRNQRD